VGSGEALGGRELVRGLDIDHLCGGLSSGLRVDHGGRKDEGGNEECGQGVE